MEEHLWFYSRLKGMDNDSVKQAMPQMIRDVGLPHKRDELAMNLSGSLHISFSTILSLQHNTDNFFQNLYMFCFFKFCCSKMHISGQKVAPRQH